MVAARATRAACRSRERGGGGTAARAGARPPELLRRQGEGRWMQEDRSRTSSQDRDGGGAGGTEARSDALIASGPLGGFGS